VSTATLTPNGTVTIYGTVSTSDGGAVHTALSAVGGAYVTLSNWNVAAPSYVLVDMTTFTLPAGGVIVSVTNSVYLTGTGTYVYAWRYGSNARTQISPVPSAAWGTLTSPDSDSGGVPCSTQADLDSYQLYVYNEPAQTQVYVDRAYTTVTYIGLPSVGVSAPSGAKTVGTQTATWACTKDSSSPAGQSKYQLKLFTAAQYGAGGFNPASSTAYYDSGVVVSTALTQVLPNILPGTYRCYVRAATTNSGQDQWSAYAFSSFSVTLKQLNTWDGAAFSAKPVKVWNGSAYVESIGVWVWNGSAWVRAVGG